MQTHPNVYAGKGLSTHVDSGDTDQNKLETTLFVKGWLGQLKTYIF